MPRRIPSSRLCERVEEIHDYWLDVENRELWLHGIESMESTYESDEPGVEYMMSTRVIKNLHFLRHQSKDQPVTIHMQTCGGDVIQGMAMYDAIKSMPYHVTIISYTHARSMSSYLLQAADTRLLMPHSYFMFHWGTLGVYDHTNTVYSQVAFWKKYDDYLMDIYLEKAREGKKFKSWTDAKIRSHLEGLMDKKGDVFLSAEEAIEWGFADGIHEDWEKQE
jgi:ATP-dependent Clp protease protease subunit